MSDRRLIEDSLPLAEISEQSSREKYIRKGHINTLHLWWARRPLAACRAAVYAALVDAPKTQEERDRHHEILKKIVNWDALDPASTDHHWLSVAAENVAKAHEARSKIDSLGSRPRVLDPFSGGGAIPLEAQRLGCETYANDLNPVAHIIELGSLRYPQFFAEDRTRAPDSNQLPNLEADSEPRLAVEVERWADWVQQRVAKEGRTAVPSQCPGSRGPRLLLGPARSMFESRMPCPCSGSEPNMVGQQEEPKNCLQDQTKQLSGRGRILSSL